MPPPAAAELLTTMQSLTRSVEWLLKMPPPIDALPFVIVRAAMVTRLLGAMWNTRLAWLPSTTTFVGPAPLMNRSSVMNNSPEVSAIVPSARYCG